VRISQTFLSNNFFSVFADFCRLLKMTTAHRPTFYPAQGGSGKNEGDLSKLSKQYSARDMPAHKKLKYRQGAQVEDRGKVGNIIKWLLKRYLGFPSYFGRP
jgi:hypothetical protein